MAVKTQGTQLFLIDPEFDSNGAGIIVVGCVTTITGLTAARDQIETTCLEDSARSYEAGMATPGAASFTINFDPSEASHTRLHELYVLGTKVEWALGWGDFTPGPPNPGPAPTLDSNYEFDLPAARSWITFNGYISDLPFDFALNAVVTSNVSVQVSDFPILVPKA
ncbi:phage tail protein [Pseudomonas resinovorans]|uniref:Phage tail protein n=1 Tax=Metapseudomonas resinovorans TaxID=53412 RepID=A0ABT4Y8G6_METRE|nr:phage tail tube protein [Pseudomonas resinovorans]MDA8485165.1 phage tail protein [Pseudomonas resinovorans]